MKYRTLGTSTLKPSVISFGAWGIGGAPFWSDVPDDVAIAAMRKAFDLGVKMRDAVLAGEHPNQYPKKR